MNEDQDEIETQEPIAIQTDIPIAAYVPPAQKFQPGIGIFLSILIPMVVLTQVAVLKSEKLYQRWRQDQFNGKARFKWPL